MLLLLRMIEDDSFCTASFLLWRKFTPRDPGCILFLTARGRIHLRFSWMLMHQHYARANNRKYNVTCDNWCDKIYVENNSTRFKREFCFMNKTMCGIFPFEKNGTHSSSPSPEMYEGTETCGSDSTLLGIWTLREKFLQLQKKRCWRIIRPDLPCFPAQFCRLNFEDCVRNLMTGQSERSGVITRADNFCGIAGPSRTYNKIK